MTQRSIRRQFTTMRVLATASGVLAGIGGLVHGIGEVVQGSGSPGGIVFDSWTTGGIASNVGGEPAMSLVPDLLASGLLTLGASVAVALWAAALADRWYGGRGLAALSVIMLLVGGGFGPPVLGLLAAIVAGAANRSRHRAPQWARDRAGEALAAAWPALFWLCLADYAFLALGSPVAGVVLDIDISSAFVYTLFLAVLAMPVAALAGTARNVIPLHAAGRPKSASAGANGPGRELPNAPTALAESCQMRQRPWPRAAKCANGLARSCLWRQRPDGRCRCRQRPAPGRQPDGRRPGSL